MLNIIICEDDLRHRMWIESVIQKHIVEKKHDIKLALSTVDPIEVLDYMEAHPGEQRLYFLDVDLQHEINGIALGAEIRKADQFAKIVFITTHDEMAHLTFQHKIQAMDYIIKDYTDDITQRIAECISKAYQLHQKELSGEAKSFVVNTNGTLWHIPYDDILFFETSPSTGKRLILHTEDGEIDFRGIISDVAKLVPEFYRCHQSFIVNPSKIIRVDKATKEVEMANGKIIPVAVRKMAELLRLVG